MLPAYKKCGGPSSCQTHRNRTSRNNAVMSFSFPSANFGLCLFGPLFILAIALLTFAQEPGADQRFQEALQAQRRGDTALAVSKYEDLLRVHPDMVAARVNLGVVLVSLGRLDDAISQYRAALREAPSNRDARFNLGLTYFKKRNYSQAADEFGTLHGTEPGDVRTTTLLGICDVHLGHVADAVSLLMPIEKIAPDNLDLKLALGSALIRVGRVEEGVERVERVAKQRQSAETYTLAAESYLALTLFDRARRDAYRAIRLDPNQARAYIVIGTIDEYVGDMKGAKAAFEAALKANPDDFQSHLHLGILYCDERQLKVAREHLVRALELQPGSSIARYQFAQVERAQGDVQAAVRDLEAVVRGKPEWLKPHVQLAALYYILKRPEDGAREKEIVDQLSARDQPGKAVAPIIPPRPPLH